MKVFCLAGAGAKSAGRASSRRQPGRIGIVLVTTASRTNGRPFYHVRPALRCQVFATADRSPEAAAAASYTDQIGTAIADTGEILRTLAKPADWIRRSGITE